MRDLVYIEVDSGNVRSFAEILWSLFFESQCNSRKKEKLLVPICHVLF